MSNLWKGFAELIGAPYNKRFSTNGYGDFRIDKKGLYCYAENDYSLNDKDIWTTPDLFLSGEITYYDWGTIEEGG